MAVAMPGAFRSPRSATYASPTSLVAASAMDRCLIEPKEQGIGEPDGIFDFKQFCSPIGFDEVWEFEKKWAKADR